jgi:hypothetical protein
MTNMLSKEKDIKPFYKILHYLLTVFLLSAPALVNNFPLVYTDTGQYVLSSITLNPPGTSPMGYSFFIRAFSWQASLWPVIFMQAFVISLYFFRIIKVTLGEKNIYKRHLVLIAFMSLFTGVAWFASQLMPDVFAPILIMAFFVFVTDDWNNIVFSVFNVLVLMFALICHFTFVYIFIMLILSLFVYYFIQRKKLPNVKKKFVRGLWLFPIFLFGYFFTPTYNYVKGKEFAATSQKHVFMMARLVELGIVDDYLDEHCDEYDFELCKYKDELPNTPPAFVWDANSPFYKTGGWNSSKEEYDQIIDGIFTSPKYLSRFVYEGVISSFSQLTFFEMTYFNRYKEGSPPHDNIKKGYPNEIKRFEEARQQRERFQNIKYLNLVNLILVVFSIIIIFSTIYKGRLPEILSLLIFVILMGVLYNASISATFSNVVNRYQARVVWLLIFLALIIFIPKLISFYKNLPNAEK